MLTAKLREVADRHGASLGVTDLAPFPEVAADLVERVESGRSASLGFTYSRPYTSAFPGESFPWAASVVVLGLPYLRDGDGSSENRPVARFADGDRYLPLRNALDDVASVLGDEGHISEVVVDDDRLVDRAVAVRAGVAWWGKSSMALMPGAGPWFLIGSVVTDAVLEATPAMARSCGTCVACIPACPTGAIVAPGVLDARLCLAAVFQSRGSIPIELRSAAGSRVYGCDECLVACPPGHPALAAVTIDPPKSVGSPESDDTIRDPEIDPGRLLEMTDHQLDDEFSHWYVPGRSMRFVRRNALVAVGNQRDPSSVGLLAGYLGHPDQLLRSHAAWALGQVDGVSSRTCLERARETETDAVVLEEISLALRG